MSDRSHRHLTCRTELWIRPAGLLLFVLSGLVTSGCDKPQNISHYRVPKPRILLEENHVEQPESSRPPASMQTVPVRMIAAIVPQKAKYWFFKVTGPVDAVEKQMEPFLAFIKSVRFSDDKGTPTWTLPKGWKQLPADSARGSGPIRIKRFATIQLGSAAQPLTLAVTSLPAAQGDADQYVLLNVNRWRRQLGLSPLTQTTLYSHNTRTEEVRKIKAGNATVTLVNLIGRRAASKMPAGHPPFAGPGGSAGSGRSPQPAPRSAGVPTFKVPEGWQPGEVRGFRKAAFKVTDGSKQVEITLIDLPTSDPTANFNRWRGQVGLKPTTPDAIRKQVKSIDIGRTKGLYIELVGPAGSSPRRTILGVIAIQGRTAWFIKLIGDSTLAQREKSRFESFVKSLRFSQQ